MPRRILVPTDFSDHSALALRHACEWARRLDAELHLLTAAYIAPVWIAEGPAPIPEEYRVAIRKQASADLDALAQPLRGAGLRIGCSVSLEHPATAIRTFAATWPADLVAMGTHGRGGIPHALLGSVAERVVRTASVPVLTVRSAAGEPRPLRDILVATDFSSDARAALEWAAALAGECGARVALLHASTPPIAWIEDEVGIESLRAAHGAAQDSAREQLEALRGEFSPVVSETCVELGHPAAVIQEVARRRSSDLIVVGTRGRSGLAHVLLGSTAERVVRTAPVPAVIVKPSA